ncbi:hypothetical protein [Nostoc sp. 'Peltigera malacea cyanobiont' DB3992]|uniref:hypothetical protein n=1 Tax=Nostoc sp. 'Peltigera malacea cyanobiont' DB3992 TaxID=1206980 RepID=UPI00211F0CBD|nr:hypothetical protein [Nostoc sp. 'Peltigera malacea cyanobiont' DB3992]
MMNIRRVLVVTAIPVLVGTFGFVSLNQANAANQFERIAQAQQPPNQPSNERPRLPRPDFAAAATKLGVTEAQLKRHWESQPIRQIQAIAINVRPNLILYSRSDKIRRLQKPS